MKQGKAKSISQKLNSTHSYQRQHELLTNWRNTWKSDSEITIRLAEQALKQNNIGESMHYLHQLKSLQDKKFDALQSIINKVCDSKRILKDSPVANEPNDAIVDDIPKPPIRQERTFLAETIPQVKEQKELDIAEMVKYYNGGMGTKALAEDMGIGQKKVIKILVTAGVYTSELYDQIKTLREKGMPESQIASIMGMSIKALNDYTPYKKGLYGLENASENAMKIRELRRGNGK